MIFDLRDPVQRCALNAETARHCYRYGNAYVLPPGRGLVLLLESRVNPAAVR